MMKMIVLIITHSILIGFGRARTCFDQKPVQITGMGCCGYGYGYRARYPGVYPCTSLRHTQSHNLLTHPTRPHSDLMHPPLPTQTLHLSPSPSRHSPPIVHPHINALRPHPPLPPHLVPLRAARPSARVGPQCEVRCICPGHTRGVRRSVYGAAGAVCWMDEGRSEGCYWGEQGGVVCS
jgi:hypothetical protein